MINAPSISQYAAIEALKNSDDYIKEKASIYDERRKYIIKRFKEMEFLCISIDKRNWSKLKRVLR